MIVKNIVLHRINKVSQLLELPKNYGAEIDIRYHENDLILHHDPFSHHQDHGPEKFCDFLANYKRDELLICNIKSEGIEQKCIDLINQFQIKNWFFLDLSMPYFVRYANYAKTHFIKGFTPDNLAVRLSEEEPIEYAINFAHKAGWVWVDCFTKIALDDENYAKLKALGFKICIVSPELQKHDPEKMISGFQKKFHGKEIDAVCTKYPNLWVSK